MLRLLLFVSFLLWGGWANVCLAQAERPLAGAYWIDKPGHTAVSELPQAEFIAFSGALNLGYVPHPIWLRLHVPATGTDAARILRVRPAFLESLVLFEMDPDGHVVNVQTSGRESPLDTPRLQSVDLGFRLPARTSPFDVYLRLDTATSALLECTLLPEAQAQRSAQAVLACVLLYLGVLLSLMLWALLEWWIRRDFIYLLFAVRKLASIFYLITLEGLIRYYFSDHLQDSDTRSLYFFGIWTIFPATLFFEAHLWHELGASVQSRAIARRLSVLLLAGPLLHVAGYHQAALKFSTAFFCIMLLYSAAMSFLVPLAGRGHLEAWTLRLLRLGYIGLLGFVFLLAMVFYGWGWGDFSDFHVAAYFYNAFSSGVFVVFLISRARRRDMALQEAQLQLAYAEERYLHEQERRQEKEKFLTMLGHELKNPLSVIRLLASSAQARGQAILKAADDMARLIDRVLQSERLGHEAQSVTSGPLDLLSLLHDLRLRQTEPDRILILPHTEVTIESDAELLKAVFSNLLDNALKYSPPRSEVRVTLSADERGVVVQVSNALGEAGRPDPRKVFGKYYRNAQAQRQIGSGLGLYLIAAWMESLRGSIRLVPAEASGPARVAFDVWVPR